MLGIISIKKIQAVAQKMKATQNSNKSSNKV
jgi:hypothetical protein